MTNEEYPVEKICLNCLHRRKFLWQNKSGYGQALICVQGRVKQTFNYRTCEHWQDDITALEGRCDDKA